MEHRHESYDVENPYAPLASFVKGKLDSLPKLSGEYCCIYRVPKKIREKQEADFTPRVVSIGPLHHGKENLQVMEEHKQRYLKEFLKRTKVSTEDFIAVIKENEAQLRACYEEIIGMDSDEFVVTILVDATFIIELLLKHGEASHQEFVSDRIYNKPWMIGDVILDMLMLENQIPYFILEKLYDAAKMSLILEEDKWQLSIIAHFYHCFETFFPGKYDVAKQPSPSGFLHFLDFFKIAYQPLAEPGERKIESFTKWTITELKQAGVKFQAPKEKNGNMFDIRFHDGILQIPKITFKEGTNVLLRNLVAFERCHYDTNFLADYAIFLDSLIDTDKDIDILIRNEVLEAWASDSKEVANLFNSISSSCMFDNNNNFFYARVWKDLDHYCKVPWNKWKAILRQNYLNTPWAIISLLAAAVLLILTALQTIWTMTHP